MSAAERVLKLFQNYFRDIEHVGKYSRKPLKSFLNNFGQVSIRAGILLNYFRQTSTKAEMVLVYFTCNHGIT